jgi:hypothetical protein
MKKNNIYQSTLKGENMKRTILVLVLALVLVFSLTTIAGAKFVGRATTVATGLRTGGYLAWGEANAIYTTINGLPAGSEQVSAHGGYSTATVKCQVCHSVHRAFSAGNTGASSTYASAANGVYTNNALTVGASCVNCHTVWGGGTAARKIEWAQTSPAPHGARCTTDCHGGGIHGGGGSIYHAQNVWLLGNRDDAAIGAALAAGNWWVYPSDGVQGIVNPADVGSTTAMDGVNGAWFYNGTTGLPANGSFPPAARDMSFAFARSYSTGYLCGRSGCHTNSMFAVAAWGYAEQRAQQDNTGQVFPGGPATGLGSWLKTGHGVPSRHAGGNPSCAPCHPAGLAGGYRNQANKTYSADELKAQSFGCDQCHDTVGVVTNTTSWPHSIRNIAVYEWDATGAMSSYTPSASMGNQLWMYKYSIGVLGGVAGGTAANPVNFNKKFEVANKTTGTAGFESSIGLQSDGVCLKCHVPVDAASFAMMRAQLVADGITPLIADNVPQFANPGTTRSHGQNMSSSGALVGTFARPSTNSSNIFTWR